MQINIITRCTRVNNLVTVRDSIFNNIVKGINIQWHIVFDTNVLKDIDAEILAQIDDINTNLHFKKGDGWGLSQLNNLIHSLDGWIYHLDDDNILHPDFYSELLHLPSKHTKANAIVFALDVAKKGFAPLPTVSVPFRVTLQDVTSYSHCY